MNAKLVQSWESSEKENWVAIWKIYLLATEHYSIDQFIDGWLDGQEAIIGYLWDYYIIMNKLRYANFKFLAIILHKLEIDWFIYLL
jgi:hypothetical protein